MDYMTVVAALLAALVTASVASWAALRTTGTSWRAAHADRTFEALADLLDATDVWRNDGAPGPGYESAVTRVRLTTEKDDFEGLQSVLVHADVLRQLGPRSRASHPYFDRLALLDRAVARERAAASVEEDETGIPMGEGAASYARQELRAFYAEQDQGGEPDPAPVRKSLVRAEYCSDDLIDDLFISADTRRKLDERKAEREEARERAAAELSDAREALTSAVRKWARKPSGRALKYSSRQSRTG
ncbi:hypothetical protein [Streptomyces sp. PT12]|uniref:hypothetical protein n=1 Tax=Streptomyces sp. PT12 TaxID=1510197 RepID=UPI0011BE3146|nr:hypothetical protein [Streptomyces sp. PT12]